MMNLTATQSATHPARVDGTGRKLYIAYVAAQCLVGVCLALIVLSIPSVWPDGSILTPVAFIIVAAVLSVVVKALWKRMWWFIPYSRQRPADEPFAGAVVRKAIPPLALGAVIVSLLAANDRGAAVVGVVFAPIFFAHVAVVIAKTLIRRTSPDVATIVERVIVLVLGVVTAVMVAGVADREPGAWSFYALTGVLMFALVIVMTADRWGRGTSDGAAVYDQPFEDADERQGEEELAASPVDPDARTAVDAVMILEALARILEVSPNAISAEDRELHALYVRKAAEAVIHEAGLSASELEAGRSYGGSEWNGALLSILYEDDLVVPLYKRMTKRS